MTKRLQDKVVVVAGGATGIGAATAVRLAAEGARVVVGDINDGGGAETVDRIVADGGTASAVPCDISDEDAVNGLFAAAVAAHGGVDGLFNVAADLSRECVGRDSDLLDIPLAVWDRTMAVDLRGYVLTMRAAIPLMIERGGGAIVNTSSDTAFGGPVQRPAYAAAKMAINTLTQHVAARFGPDGIRCNSVSPGLIETDTAGSLGEKLMDAVRQAVPLRRLGAVDDIANAVVFLLSDEASYVTGQVHHVDGGMRML